MPGNKTVAKVGKNGGSPPKDIKKPEQPEGQNALMKRFGFPVALLILFAVLMLPTPEGLLPAGHRMLAILCFAVVIWLTEAVTYDDWHTCHNNRLYPASGLCQDLLGSAGNFLNIHDEEIAEQNRNSGKLC